MCHYDLILPHGDTLIIAGDLTKSGSEAEMVNVLCWIEEQTKRYKVIFVAGNHDRICEKDKSTFLILKQEYSPNSIYLCESSYTESRSGLKFHGLPFVSTINGNWSFERSEQEMKEIAARIPDDVDVLISHGPPYGILDNFYRKKVIDDPTARFGMRFEEIELRVGSKALLKRIQQIKPQYVVFGHIHENYGRYTDNLGIQYINAAVLDEHYDLVREAQVIDVE